MQITILGDTASAQDRLANLGAQMPRALTRALNRTLSEGRTAMTRALAEDTGLTQARIRDNVSEIRATFENQVATLAVRGRRIPLIAFGAQQARAGVSYRIGQGGRGVVPGAFLATMPRTGHRGVFARKPSARARRIGPGIYHALPIIELYGPSLPQAMQKAEIIDAVTTRITEAFPGNLEHEIDVLSR